MKTPTTLILLTALLAPGIAWADTEDEYVACVIGHAAVALNKMKTKDAGKAQAIAYQRCKAPKGLRGDEQEGMSDFINMQVLRLAGQM